MTENIHLIQYSYTWKKTSKARYAFAFNPNRSARLRRLSCSSASIASAGGPRFCPAAVLGLDSIPNLLARASLFESSYKNSQSHKRTTITKEYIQTSTGNAAFAWILGWAGALERAFAGPLLWGPLAGTFVFCGAGFGVPGFTFLPSFFGGKTGLGATSGIPKRSARFLLLSSSSSTTVSSAFVSVFSSAGFVPFSVVAVGVSFEAERFSACSYNG